MSPRKTQEGHVPRWLYKSQGRRKKAIIEGPYDCPTCGKRELTIKTDKITKIVEAKCPCGLSKNLEFRSIFQPVDYYGKLVDQYYKRTHTHTQNKVNTRA